MAKSLDQEFIEYVAKALVNHPDEVKSTRTVDEMGVLLTLKVHPEDMSIMIGKGGNTAKAIRALLRVIGAKTRARINFKIEEPAGGSKQAQTSSKSEDLDDLKL